MYDTHVYLAFDSGYFIVATEIVNSRYLTSVLAAAYGSFGLSDVTTYSVLTMAPKTTNFAHLLRIEDISDLE